MSIKISDFQNRPVQAGTDKSVSRAGDSSAAPAGQAAAGNGSPVQITDQARLLASLEQAVNNVPEVNESRVAEIRLALEEGRYQINADRIADKLLRTEHDLGAK